MNTITPDPRFGARSIDGSKRNKDNVHTSDEKRCHWPCYLDFEKKTRLAHVHHDEGTNGELLIVDGNIPTGALNFLPRRDMLGENL